MALTRIGVGGPMAALPEFEPPIVIVNARIINVVGDYVTAVTVTGEGKMRV